MDHNWIFYKNKNDYGDEKSYYCSNCNMKIFTWTMKTGNGSKLATVTDINTTFEYGDFTCEEYIIKNIIE